MLDIRRLRLLRELKVRGTLASVAAALNFSPSSVSQQLALLENEVGVPLLRKTGRRVTLTPQAEILVDHAAGILDAMERAEADLAESLTTVTGTVRVAVFQSAALALMPDALTILGRDYPEVRIEMTQREPETALYETWARDFDLVIAEQYPGHAAPRHPGLDRVQLTTDAIHLAVPAESLGGGDIRSIADTASRAWVMEPRGAASRHWAEQACRQAGFEPDVRYETADLQAQIRLIESGNAVGLMPELVWTGRTPTVRLLDLPGRPRRTIFTSVREAGSQRPAILACREVLERTARLLSSA
ncbi:LysR substrate-binding domain-containing protein [Arthrobacter jinronghuae]|uniref:LysR substrate-binding domain-containing protein n=1 Tax=Arthrobacter jinronghuae TaxID=2964609 RepID=A0ABT1NQU5_9MICC|nr:LysR substrate-binding domain-containing protein [Arthrobacter jinronghuae]MCQ1948896.1 LysR substrate-binding domain-containing protein [Arthrobacter jinronghuae]MCQ1952222.1 LysR substrate-binding domain-containing protein [Arthrobacter sp. zg-Y238]MCQ1955661.1 LysR substrate-binding domain-containing protein [Arthrobacter jinronghuae]UWX78300.1 LysR substrate-binding domain-containing protein [Arthrobacter jinronghuae]